MLPATRVAALGVATTLDGRAPAAERDVEERRTPLQDHCAGHDREGASADVLPAGTITAPAAVPVHVKLAQVPAAASLPVSVMFGTNAAHAAWLAHGLPLESTTRGQPLRALRSLGGDQCRHDHHDVVEHGGLVPFGGDGEGTAALAKLSSQSMPRSGRTRGGRDDSRSADRGRPARCRARLSIHRS